MSLEIQRLSAFPFEGRGGNPAGVVLDAPSLSDSEMLAIAAEVGYSETVFLTNLSNTRLKVRYFSPEMEVDFCGHATIAAGVALGRKFGIGEFVFETNTGDVDVSVSETNGIFSAELTSNVGSVSKLPEDICSQLLGILGFTQSMLASNFTPMVTNAGNAHPILVFELLESLAKLAYDFEALKLLCRSHGWPTVQLIAREADEVWRSRNPFAFGGVYEDPATGSAAAAFGVYLRETGKVEPGASFEIRQGFEMGQPSLLKVTVDSESCRVSGSATYINA